MESVAGIGRFRNSITDPLNKVAPLTLPEPVNSNAPPFAECTSDSGISVRLFSGDNSRYQQFIESAWTAAYDGKMSFPVWSADYFDWQFGDHQNEPNRRLAAYDGDRLVGVLAGRAADFLVDGERIPGAHYSWLSVHPGDRGLRIAPLLDDARVRLEESLGSQLVVSYRFHGSKHSLAERPRQKSTAKDFNRRTGFWARPLDPTALRKWNCNRMEGWLAQLAAPVLPWLRESQGYGIRRFHPDDLADCLRLVSETECNFVACNSWTEQSLQWQLNGHPVTQTVVAEADQNSDFPIGGFVNFHLLDFAGRNRKPVAIIDLCCCHGLSYQRQRQLLNGALWQMKQQGAILALKSRTGDVGTMLMLRTGFTPRKADSALVLQWIQSPRTVNSSIPIRLLWR